LTHFAIDTGPLVALLNRHDAFHGWAAETLDDVERPIHTCEAVITEACFLLRRTSAGSEALLALLEQEVLLVDFSLASEAQAVRKLMRKYSSVPMSLADACLVRMAELEKDLSIITLDNDFHVYRRGRAGLSVVSP
jgi:predicted nucleic acid-binding protein